MIPVLFPATIDLPALNIDYRPAWPDELEPTLRSFRLPFRPGPGLRLFLACATEPRERVIGCLACAQTDGSMVVDGQEKRYFVWRMLPAYTGSEVEQHLLSAGLAYLADDSDLPLLAQDMVSVEDADREAQLIALGFQRVELVDEYQASFETVWQRCQRIHRMLERRGAIPAAAEVGPFEGRSMTQVRAELHNAHIMNSLDFDARCHGQHAEPIDLQRSTAIVLDGELIGLMAVCPIEKGQGYMVAGRWVAEAHRQSWVNAKLIYHSVRQGVPLNLSFVRFVANLEHHQETARLAQRLGGERVRRLQRFGRDGV